MHPDDERWQFELGARLRDRITGFVGIAVARTEWLYGCMRYGLVAEALGEHGKRPEEEWIDQGQLVLVATRDAVVHEAESERGEEPADPGTASGPTATPRRAHDPR